MPYGDKPFGLREIKLVRGSTVVELPNAQTMEFSERLTTGELRGNDATQAVASYTDALEWSLEAGGISVAAWALMMGRTATETGTTPNQTNTMTARAGDAMPWFKIYGKSLGDAGGDVHVKILKAKLTEPIEGTFGDAEFFVTSCSGLAVDDGALGIYQIVQNETAAALPSS